MRHMFRWLAGCGAFLVPVVSSSLASASSIVSKDAPATGEAEESKPDETSPIRNSALVFDQSVTTQTAHLEPNAQQSYVPLYEWWLSFRPRYYFTNELYVWGRFDYFKEFTNAEQTTKYREDVFGDIWTSVVYETVLKPISKNTKGSLGLRFLFPTSKQSQDGGILVQGGATAGLKQQIPLNGKSAPFLNAAHLGIGTWYNHPFSRATSAVNGGLNYVRQDTEGRSFVSDQLSGAMLVNHQLVTSVDAGLQITPKLSFGLDMIWINQWHYAATPSTVSTLTGPATVDTPPGFDTTYTANTWFLAAIDYDLMDELSLSLGYYNLTNEIAPDGQRRGVFGKDNIWWSPDARVFFDITANLDKIYDLARGKKAAPPVSSGTASTPARPLTQ